MHPFEFIILFFSFIYTLALTHLLFAATRMIRHRRDLVFSWPHALWMLAVLVILGGNWLSFWDFKAFDEMRLPMVASGFVISIAQYFVCALVSPDFEGGETYNMKLFHEREHRTYIGGILAFCVMCIGVNTAAGASLGVVNWAAQNSLVLVMLVVLIPPLITRRPWVHILSPALMVCLGAAFSILYYPVLK